MRVLSREEARRVYDRIGARQDTQAFYEDPATDLVIEYGGFETAHRVFEFGCGTGRFAARLLAERLPDTAHYRGVDLSPTMIALAQQRLAPFESRAEALLTDGSPPMAEAAASCDRFVSSYVFDLLADDEIETVLDEAHRMLEPSGLLCLCSLSTGTGPFSRLVASVWSRIHAWRPALVGGCRPLDLLVRVPSSKWRVRHHAQVTPFGVPSEIVVAERC